MCGSDHVSEIITPSAGDTRIFILNIWTNTQCLKLLPNSIRISFVYNLNINILFIQTKARSSLVVYVFWWRVNEFDVKSSESHLQMSFLARFLFVYMVISQRNSREICFRFVLPQRSHQAN